MVTEGVTVIIFEVEPLFHTKIVPPDALKVVLVPIQILVVPEIPATSELPIVTVTWPVVLPQELEAATEYVVATVGETVMDAALEPVFHAKFPFPVAVSMVLPPGQIVTLAPALTVGRGFTVTLAVVLLEPHELDVTTE